MEKHCPCCHVPKDLSEFRKSAAKQSGFVSYCRPCESRMTLARQHGTPMKRADWFDPSCQPCAESRRQRAMTVIPRPAEERFWKKVDRSGGPDACWPWTGATQKGYGALGIGGRKGKTVSAHRFAWELEHGPIPEGMNVLHHCDNPPCCNAQHPNHLFLGTFSDNTRDMHEKGRDNSWMKRLPDEVAHGRLPPFHKLTLDDVRYIRQRQGIDRSATLAERFGVHVTVIQRIWSRTTWGYVE